MQNPHRERIDCSNISPGQTRSSRRTPRMSLKSIVNASPSGVVVLDETGTILQINNAWQQFAVENGLLTHRYGIGLNYLELRKKAGDASDDERTIADGIGQVVGGLRSEFDQQYVPRNSRERR